MLSARATHTILQILCRDDDDIELLYAFLYKHSSLDGSNTNREFHIFRFAYYGDMTVIVISYYFLSSIVCVCVLFSIAHCFYFGVFFFVVPVVGCLQNHMRTLFSPFVVQIFFVGGDVILSHALLFFAHLYVHAYASLPLPLPPPSTLSSLSFHIFCCWKRCVQCLGRPLSRKKHTQVRKEYEPSQSGGKIVAFILLF